MEKKEFPTQSRLHELLERHYDCEGRLYFVAKVKRGTIVKKGDILYGYKGVFNRGKPSEHTRYHLGIDGYNRQIAVFNYIYTYGDYDTSLYSVDHIDRNPTNDHHSNLRLLTKNEQQHNKNSFKRSGSSSSSYFGVYWVESRNKWVCSIRVEGKLKYIGYFETEIEAAHAYDEVSWNLYQDYGKLNFPENYRICA